MLTVPSTDGVTLAVHDLGGTGPELLYSHATGFHAHVWEPLAAHLADRYHGWAPDYRGHGHSTRPRTDDVDWRGYGEDCLAVVDALGLRRPFGLGHSKGGAALLRAEIARPGTFAALAVFEPVVFPPTPADDTLVRERGMADGTRRRKAVFPSHEAAIAHFGGRPPFDVLHPDALRAYVVHGFAEQADGTVVLRCDPEHEARTYEGGSRHDTWDHLGRVGCPVLVLSGASAEGGPGALAAQVAERLPGGRHLAFESLGHFGPLQDPAAVAAAVAGFFAGLAGA